MLPPVHVTYACDYCGHEDPRAYRSRASARRAQSAHLATCPTLQAFAALMRATNPDADERPDETHVDDRGERAPREQVDSSRPEGSP